MTDRVLVTGAGGFLGGHLVGRLAELGHRVIAVDSKPLDHWQQRWEVPCGVGDLRDPECCRRVMNGVTRVYHLAADVGGVGYIARNDWSCATSVTATVNILEAAGRAGVESVVYTSSACVYPVPAQHRHAIPLTEDLAMPAAPEGGYGWEKLFSEQLCAYSAERFGMVVRVARLFNVYGPFADWATDRAKAPAAICRKIAHASLTGRRTVEIWGDGTQLRSFLYVSDCLDALTELARPALPGPVNLASTQLVSIRQLAELTAEVAGVEANFQYDQAQPTGVAARIPDISLARQQLDWVPVVSLAEGVQRTYQWVYDQTRSAG